jgi:hypothetical protein
MSNLINKYDNINVGLNSYDVAEEHFSAAEHGLANQNTSDGDLFDFQPLVSDQEAEAAYKVWQGAWRISKEMLRNFLKGHRGFDLIDFYTTLLGMEGHLETYAVC